MPLLSTDDDMLIRRPEERARQKKREWQEVKQRNGDRLKVIRKWYVGGDKTDAGPPAAIGGEPPSWNLSIARRVGPSSPGARSIDSESLVLHAMHQIRERNEQRRVAGAQDDRQTLEVPSATGKRKLPVPARQRRVQALPQPPAISVLNSQIGVSGQGGPEGVEGGQGGEGQKGEARAEARGKSEIQGGGGRGGREDAGDECQRDAGGSTQEGEVGGGEDTAGTGPAVEMEVRIHDDDLIEPVIGPDEGDWGLSGTARAKGRFTYRWAGVERPGEWIERGWGGDELACAYLPGTADAQGHYRLTGQLHPQSTLLYQAPSYIDCSLVDKTPRASSYLDSLSCR